MTRHTTSELTTPGRVSPVDRCAHPIAKIAHLMTSSPNTESHREDKPLADRGWPPEELFEHP